jgi:1-acyl-sn-glycerol-3-phosphate acyltransferase
MKRLSKKPLFIRIAQPTYGRYLIRRTCITPIGMEHIANLTPPFLVLANHVHTMDPFIISSASPRHIRWVAGSYLFHLFSLRFLLERWVGAISKIQGRSDLHTIKAIGAALKEGDIVGLFPEGTRSWDGEPVGFDRAVAKMIKIFNVPTVVLTFKGIYGTKPRWATYRRTGSSELYCHPPIPVEEVRSLSVDELYRRIGEQLEFSYRRWQEEHPSPFYSPHSAEGVEQILYLCPHCHSCSTIKGEGQTIRCTNCTLTLSLDEYDRLYSTDQETPFRDIAAWRVWQREYLSSTEGERLHFPPDSGLLFQRIERRSLRTLSTRYTLSLTAQGLHLAPRKGEDLLFSFDTITSMVINLKNTLEITAEGVRYRLRLRRGQSVLKYIEYNTARQRVDQGALS